MFQYCNHSFHMTQQEMETAAQEFWDEVEREAEKLEITCDYYLLEFFTS